MIHFAYPNASQRKKAFLGCGRYCPAEHAPADKYKPAHQDKTAEFEKLLPLIPKIAPDTRQRPEVHLYETQDQPREIYGGESKQLAFLLASVARVRSLKIATARDIWCTGSIGVVEADYPAVSSLEDETFAIKLQAFLADDNSDLLFIVPAANITPEARRLCETHGAQVYDLNAFEQTESYQQPLTCKTIVTVQPDKDELHRLISIVFQPGENPYKGLNAFQEDDADRFFGRAELIDFLWTKYQQCQTNQLLPRLLILTGPSGSGKSSLLQAGVAAKLRQQQIPSIIFQPGQHPLDTLHDTLSQEDNQRHALGNEPLAMLIDQFEDLYFECRDVDEQEAFITNLLTISSDTERSITIILSLRSSFQDRLFEQLTPAIEPQRMLTHHAVFVPSMDSLALRQVICEPAKYSGVIWNEQLVYELIKQTEQHQPGALPLLEVALDSLWEAAKETPSVSPEATLAELNAKGGISAALAIKAEKAVHGFSVDEELLRRLFLALVRLDEEQRYVRRRNVPYSNIPAYHQAPDQVRMIFRHFSGNAARFVTLASANHEPTVEIIHDSLIVSWEKLRKWTADDYEFQLWRQRVQIALKEWEQSQRDDNALLRGARLSEAENWLSARTDDLPEAERRFIESGIALKNREIAAVEAQRQRELATERQHAKRLRTRLIWAVIALIVAVGAGVTAYIGFERANFERKTAENERDNAKNLERIAKQEQEKAEIKTIDLLNQNSKIALSLHDDLNALITAIKAGKQSKLVNTPITLRFEILLNLREMVEKIHEKIWWGTSNNFLEAIAFLSDKIILASSSEQDIIVQQVFDKQVIVTIHESRLYHQQGKLKIGDIKSQLNSLMRTCIKLNPDATILASGHSDGMITLWSIPDGKNLLSLNENSRVTNLSFSTDGILLASGHSDGSIMLWNVHDEKKLISLNGKNRVTNLAFSSDRTRLIAGHSDGTITIWNVDDGKNLISLNGHNGEVLNISFSPDNQIFISTGKDKVIKLWDINDFKEIRDLPVYAIVNSISFSPDGKLVASGNADGSIRIWQVIDGKEIFLWQGYHSVSVKSPEEVDPVKYVMFSHDGEWLVSRSDVIKLWKINKNNENKQLYGHKDKWISSLDFSPDGKILASGCDDNTVKLWAMPDGKEIATLKGHNDEIRSVKFNPDGTLLASGSADHTIKIWNVSNQKEIITLHGHNSPIWSIGFNPDGKILASGSSDGVIKFWDVLTGRNITRFCEKSDVISIAFSPDGKLLASGNYDNTIRLWKSIQSNEIATFPKSALFSEWADKTFGCVQTELEKNRAVLTLRGHDEEVTSVAFSPDGKFLASGSAERIIRIWNVSDGNEVTRLSVFSGDKLDYSFDNLVDFSPDGQFLASGSVYGLIKLWDYHNGKEIATIGNIHGVYSLRFNPTGKLLATGDSNGVISIWNLDLDHWLIRGCEWVSDYLKNNPTVSKEDRILCDDILKAEIRASHIFVAVKPNASQTEKDAARRKIEKILARLNTGDDFAELAAQYSEDHGTKENGGDLGFFPRGMMVKPLEDAAFRLKEGDISDIVETSAGYHLIKLTGRRGVEE